MKNTKRGILQQNDTCTPIKYWKSLQKALLQRIVCPSVYFELLLSKS